MPCGSTLGGGEGATSVVASGVSTLRGGVGGPLLLRHYSCWWWYLWRGGHVEISDSCFRDSVFFSPSIFRGVVGFWSKRACMRSSPKCVDIYSDDNLDNGRFSGNNSFLLETHVFAVLDM